MFTNLLTTQRHSINYGVIMRNALKKRFWKTTWNLYEGYNTKISMTVANISPQDDDLTLRLKLHFDGTDFIGDDYDPDVWSWKDLDNLTTTQLISVSIKPDHYNEEVFIKSIVGNVRRGMNTLIEQAVTFTKQRNEMVKLDEALMEEHRQELIDYLDECEIIQQDIRDSYISDNEKYINTNQSELTSTYKLEERDSLIDMLIQGITFE